MLERLTEFEATFCDRDVRAAALVAGVGLPVDEALAAVERLRGRGELLELADGRFTTRGHRVLEAQAVKAARELAQRRPAAVSPAVVDAELDVLKGRLSEGGGVLDPGQERAVRAACSAHGLVVIEGQAGTGKSTALGAVARAHEHAGARVLVTSTGALAAERLAAELRDVGVDAEGCSTAALRARVTAGSVLLDAGVTVIHDEAALASTREQQWLFGAASRSGARVIEVGDPRQSQAVGAGGLWAHVHAAAERQGAAVALERIVRARDPSDRRCQSLWRSGQHERALAGYESRGRLVIADTQRGVEDRALESAQADRQAGRSVLVVCQTSNERLDELNARAQAIRFQAGELGDTAIPLAGRAYGLRAGDGVQIRSGVAHPELGRVTNGTAGHVVDVDGAGAHARLRFADGREGMFDRAQLDAAQVRLAYVVHPFPAQGQTCEVAHVICAEHPTAEGSYVALTRARAGTYLYASHERLDADRAQDRDRDQAQGVVGVLAEQMGRSDPEVPSIALPVAHERRSVAEPDRDSATASHAPVVVDGEQVAEVSEPQHASQLEVERDRGVGPGRERERERLEGLRVRRDELKAVVDGYPQAAAREVDRLRERAEQERETAAGDEWRTERFQADRRALGPLARHGATGRDARQRAQEFAERAATERQHAAELDARAQRIAEGPGGPESWERTHPDARSDLHQAEQQLAQAVSEQALEREQAQERGGVPAEAFDPTAARQELSWLGEERDRLRVELRGYPSHTQALVQQAEREATAAERRAGEAQERAAAGEAQLADLGWLARRGQRGDQLADHAAQAKEQAEREQEYAQNRREHARELRDSPGGPAAWDRAHPGVRERLEVYDRAHGQAAGYHAAHQLQRGDRASVERLLGERPSAGREDEQTVWDHAAQALLAYRLAHLDQEPEHGIGLGPAPAVERRDARRGWEHAREQLREARAILPEPPDRGAGLALDSPERHELLADELRLRGIDEDAIHGVLAVQIAQPHAPDQAVRTARERVDELARLARSHEIDRGPSLGL